MSTTATTLPTVVSVLEITHKHGTDFYVCATEEIANAKLDGYVQEWWESEMDDEMPDSAEERIEKYFKHLEGRENWEIGSSKIYTSAEE